MKIVEFSAENVKRLVAVNIKPDGSLVLVGGRNSQGKSSVLDSIMYAIAGGGSLPGEPLRRGQKKGSVRLDLGDLVVRRTFTPSGSALTVTGADGVKFSTPQAVLDKLCGKLAFDPLDFARRKPAEQRAVLANLVGIDHGPLDATRRELFEQRTELGREVKRLEGVVSEAVFYTDAPADDVSVDVLLEERSAREDEAQSQRDSLAELESERQSMQDRERRIVDLEAELLRIQSKLQAEREAQAAAKQYEQEMLAYIGSFVDPNVEEIDQQIREASEANRKLAANRQRSESQSRLEEARSGVDDLTSQIQAIDAQKAAEVAAAAFPVPGLSITDDGVELNGAPLEQAGSAEKIRASVAIGLALNPELRVMLIRDGSLLDDESLALVADMADAADAQVWVERVGTADPCAVVIEDGSLAGHAGSDHGEPAEPGSDIFGMTDAELAS